MIDCERESMCLVLREATRIDAYSVETDNQ